MRPNAARMAPSIVISQGRLRANRANAMKSTGPRTVIGVLSSSRNALRHGLSASANVVIEGEDASAYERHCAEVVADLNAQGTVETHFALNIANILWRLGRVMPVEAAAFALGAWTSVPSATQLSHHFAVAAERERNVDALGSLLLPRHREIEPETARVILQAFVDYLDADERLTFVGEVDDPIAVLLSGTIRCKAFKVDTVLRWIVSGERRLRRAGRGAAWGERGFVATVYKFWSAARRHWQEADEDARREYARLRTAALLQGAEQMHTVGRYETRLRKDLLRMMEAFFDLQERRRGGPTLEQTTRDESETPFLRNEPIAVPFGGSR